MCTFLALGLSSAFPVKVLGGRDMAASQVRPVGVRFVRLHVRLVQSQLMRLSRAMCTMLRPHGAGSWKDEFLLGALHLQPPYASTRVCCCPRQDRALSKTIGAIAFAAQGKFL